jgi:hypothetical protein
VCWVEEEPNKKPTEAGGKLAWSLLLWYIPLKTQAFSELNGFLYVRVYTSTNCLRLLVLRTPADQFSRPILRSDACLRHMPSPWDTVGCLTSCNEASGSIKCWEIIDYLSDWRVLLKDSAP